MSMNLLLLHRFFKKVKNRRENNNEEKCHVILSYTKRPISLQKQHRWVFRRGLSLYLYTLFTKKNEIMNKHSLVK